MTSAVEDFKDIRSRMKGDDWFMPAVAPSFACHLCQGEGWCRNAITLTWLECPRCNNPNDLPGP